MKGRQGVMTMTRHGIHKIALVAFAAVTFGTVGCGGGGGSGFCSANVAAEWVLTENGVQVSCQPGDEVDLNVDDMTATFACSAGAGTTASLAGGVSHDIDLTLFDAANNSLSQTQTMRVFVACGAITDIGLVEFSLTP
jgi:hypothetical protein